MGQGAHFLDHLLNPAGRLIVVSGPSGVGKDSVLEAFFQLGSRPSGLVRCITATTRRPRANEVEGRDYFFLTREEFEQRAAAGYFLEYAEYNGNLYGTPGDFVARERSSGRDVLLKIEVQGALQVRRSAPDALLIFLAPPSELELERRLRGRSTGNEAEVQRRLAIARSELEAAPQYDYLVVNDQLEEAADALRAIILAERAKIASR